MLYTLVGRGPRDESQPISTLLLPHLTPCRRQVSVVLREARIMSRFVVAMGTGVIHKDSDLLLPVPPPLLVLLPPLHPVGCNWSG